MAWCCGLYFQRIDYSHATVRHMAVSKRMEEYQESIRVYPTIQTKRVNHCHCSYNKDEIYPHFQVQPPSTSSGVVFLAPALIKRVSIFDSLRKETLRQAHFKHSWYTTIPCWPTLQSDNSETRTARKKSNLKMWHNAYHANTSSANEAYWV